MTAAASVEPERTVQGLIAFTDIVGFTELTATQGDELALAVVTRQEEIVSGQLPEGARIVKELGDGLLLFFPQIDAGVATCLRLQDVFDRESESVELPIWVRMGLHWGSATRYRNDLIGHDVNVASRIADVAGPGEVLLSETVLQRIEGAHQGQFEEIGPVVMKGIPSPLRLFRAVRPVVPTYEAAGTSG